jgi:hypothetical protein
MKRALMIAVSAIVAAGALIVWQNHAINELRRENARAQQEQPRTEREPAGDGNLALRAEGLPRPATEPFNWRTVESEDYRRYIANLRAIGCPEQTIRDIIVADVNALFAERAKRLRALTNRVEYWKGGNLAARVLDGEAVRQRRELDKEKESLLKALLGDKAPAVPETPADSGTAMTAMLDFLPSEKLSQVSDVVQRFQSRVMKSSASSPGGGADRKSQLAQLDAELAQALTPEEKFEVDLRMSSCAQVLRMSLAEFEPTEQEFRDMFKARKQLDDEFGLSFTGKESQPERERVQRAIEELGNQFKNILGEQRYREFQNAGWLLTFRTEVQEQAAKVRGDSALTPEQRQSMLNFMRAQVEKDLANRIGQDALASYVERHIWIRELNR